MKSSLYLIIRREYLERVQRKSFILTTLLMPIVMLAMMMIPSLIMIFSGTESKVIAVIDNSGVVAQRLQGDNELRFVNIDDPTLTVDSLRHVGDYDAILIIGQDVVDNPGNVQMYTQSAPSIQTEQYIRSQIEDAISDQRMRRYDIENLANIIAETRVDVNMSTYRLDKAQTEETSSIVSYLLAIVMAFVLYMFLMIYGQMVMNSIIEEKNNRVLEIIVSSVRPQTLMFGKIIGVGLVALTQILIWAVLLASFSRWLMPLLTSGIESTDQDLTAAIAQMSDTGFILELFGYITIFLITGYLLYSSIFAAIGSSVDNVQDASQLTTIALVPIIIGLVFAMSVATDPNSSMAFWLSIIPFTSPLVMIARIPFGIPAWEIWLSVVLLIAAIVFMVWLAAKIYRVGIFMYGKKPTLKELIRWARYK